ncbi:MAG: helix-turn-helix domain-containing protein [Actinobacteria bacterium]|jgi:excisionase family DNA binding protein|nr:helix-turn-helix domain-containing protein [Actinomycetota bacterium]
MRALRGGAAPAEGPRFYSVAQVAEMLGMSSMTVYRAINAGEFPAVRIRGRLIVPAKAVDAMVEAAVADRTVVDAADWVVLPPAEAGTR